MKTFLPMNDSDIIRAFCSENPREVNKALSYCYREFFTYNYIICRRMKLSKESYKDVLQNSMIAFWCHLRSGTYRAASGLKTFMCSIIKRQCLKEMNRPWSLEVLLPGYPEPLERATNTVEEDFIKERDIELIRSCVDNMREPYQRTFKDFYYKDKSFESMAKKENVSSTQAIKNRKQRGMKLLKKAYLKSI